MKNINSKFENKMEETYKLLVGLELLKSDIQHLSNKEKEYFKIAINKSKFIYRTYFNSVKLLVIDIHKILNPKEHFSLKKTINYAKSNINKIDWYIKPTQEDLKIIEIQIDELIEDKLQKVKNLRNKHYAHLDKNKDSIKYDLRLIDMYEVLEKSEIIYKRISHLSNKSGAIFNIWHQPPNEIINLSKYRKINNLLLEKIWKNDWSEEFDIIWKIVNEKLT